MAYYEYRCTKCGNTFTKTESMTEHDEKRPIKCPACNAKEVVRVFSPAYVVTSKKS